MKLKILKILAIGWLFMLAAALSFHWWQSQHDGVKWLPSQQRCQLGQEACLAADGNQKIIVTANTPEITAKKAFDLEVTLENLHSEEVWLQLEGINMYMGVSRYRLKSLGDNRYGMSVRLPTCAVDRMSWKASILLQNPEQAIGYQFEFEADNNLI